MDTSGVKDYLDLYAKTPLWLKIVLNSLVLLNSLFGGAEGYMFRGGESWHSLLLWLSTLAQVDVLKD